MKNQNRTNVRKRDLKKLTQANFCAGTAYEGIVKMKMTLVSSWDSVIIVGESR